MCRNNIFKLVFIILILNLSLFSGEIDDIFSNEPVVSVDYKKYTNEGDSGSHTVSTVIRIDKCPDGSDIKIRYYTQNSSATTNDHDYKQKSGTLVFKKNSCTKVYRLNFTVYGDTKVEGLEKFYIKFADNGTSMFQVYSWKNGLKQTKIYIKDDDGADLSIEKKTDKYSYNVGETVKFTIYAKNRGPAPSTIKVKDVMPSNVSFIHGSFKVTGASNFNCNESSMTCTGSHIFKAGESVKIEFSAKVNKESWYRNMAYISDKNGIQDKINENNNKDNADFEAINRGAGVDIVKTVNKSHAMIGDRVTFNVKITNNTPVKRVLETRDWFPTDQDGENYSGTTYNAFEDVTLPTIVSDPTHSVRCKWKNSSKGRYIFCRNKNKRQLKPGESFEVKFTAKVAKTGRICNRVHGYLKGWIWMNYSDACLTVGGNAAPTIDNLSDETTYVGSSYSNDLNSKIDDPDGDPVTVTVSGLPSGFTFNTSSNSIKARPVRGPEGDYTITVKVTDHPTNGSASKTTSKTFILHVRYPGIDATNNDYSMGINETLDGNVLTEDTGSGIDRGYNIKVIKHTFLTSKHGTFSIDSDGKFSYKPDQDYKGTVKFTYTIQDEKGDTDKATVTILVKTKYSSSFKDFELINPLDTRNIIGSYTISGNTVECVTEKSSSFDGTCQKNRNYYNNKYIVKYLDIDSDNKTWNSSSALFKLPNSYMPLKDGKGIVWAGLFWQGNVNNSHSFTKNRRTYKNIQRRKELKNGTIITKDINSNSAIDITNTSANRVLINIDNESSYHEIQASRFYYDRGDYGNNGATYAAYADITNLLQSKKLAKGKHTVRVANILSNEGIEKLNGNSAGWSIVVIYKENFIDGRARNISIYNGFTAIDNTTHGDQQIKISGFKLPKTGIVKSQFSVFAGEGEYVYGAPFRDLMPPFRAWYDKMIIKRLLTDSGDSMPGAANANNIFDAKLANIDRDSGKNNDIENTNGIDIDTYDVSSIITKYRDVDPDINSVYIAISSNKDYITPSMIAFSTELYAPKVCYDADVKVGKYIDIETKDRNFTASDMGNAPLQMKVMIKSQEADFDLLDTKLKLKFNPNDVFDYKQGLSETSLPNTYQYYSAVETDSNEGEIAIGSNPTTNGGIVGAKETTYSKLYYKFNKAQFDGKFDIFVNAKVSFDGVNKVEYILSTKAQKGSIFNISRCSTNPTYDAVYGMFNIERGDSTFSQSEEDRYSLYTQVVGVPYEVSVAAYKKDSNGEYKSPVDTKATIELELIDASTFENNSSSGFDSVCKDPDTYNMGKFVKFDNDSRVKVKVPDDFPVVDGKSTYPEDLALKNAAFRVWVLTKKVGNDNVIVRHNCWSQAASSCFDRVYKLNYSSTNKCSSECTNSTGTTCYDCLRKNFAMPICSRDNFAIRPESYHIALSDNNETNSNTKVDISENSSNAIANLTAGYLYHLDVNATKFNDTINRAVGYYLNVVGDKTTKKAQSLFNDSSSCSDKSDYDLNIYMYNGKTIGYETLADNNTTPKNGMLLNNSGRYRLHIEDREWTKVDQKGYPYKPFKNHADCIDNSTSVYNGMLNSTRGCDIKSNFSSKYYDLNVNMHPYTFNLSSISSNSNPNSSANYVYINDLTKTKHLIQNGLEMAINVNGSITALGKNNKVLTNYTNGCSANNMNIDLSYSTLKDDNITTIKDILGNSAQLQYGLYVSGIDTSVNINNASSNKVNINFNKRYFDSNISGAGSALFNGYFNYKRAYNGAINPFDLHFGVLNLASPQDRSSVDLINNHIPTAKEDINSTTILYYAKAKSKSDFYDDISAKIVKTPILISLFCNESLEYCQKYGIDTEKDITSEYDWWVATSHSATVGEGKVELQTNDSSKVIVYPTIVNNFTNGINKEVKVEDRGITNKPYTAIISPTNGMIANFPWLLFNKDKDAVPDYIYKVKFVDIPDAWSGKGETGHTINVNASGRKSKKVDW